MNFFSSAGTRSGAQLEEPSGLKVALIYEDLATGARAKSFIERVLQTPEIETDSSVELCSFKLLACSEAEGILEGLAISADLVILSAHGQNPLPAPVTFWLKQWAASRRGSPSALVLSLDQASSEEPGARQLLTQVQALTAAAEVEVFHHFGSGELHHAVELGLGRLPSQLLDEMLMQNKGYRYWGINE
jgi:hypothetical protein